jgi:flagellar hook-associated protein 3 FlgL
MSGILNNVYSNISFALARQTNILTKLQEQVSTGSRINRVSDDPSTAYQVLTLNTEKGSLENYTNILADMTNTLEDSSSIVQQMASVVSKAQVLVTQVTSGTYDQTSRDNTAAAINDSLEQLVQLANTKYNGQYLFGGSDTSTAPYVIEHTDGEITSVTYQGGSESRSVNVAPGISSSAYYVGEELFSSDRRETPVFTGDTGAAAGTGTSSVTGDVWLTVTYDGTNYQVSIDDGASYVTADGSTNQAVKDSRTGKVLYVDTTGITSTGAELVQVPGTYDVFNTLISIRDSLQNDRNLSDAEVRQLWNDSVSSLEEVHNLLVQKESSMGSKIEFLSGLESNLETVKANTDNETSQLQDADIAQVAVDLTRYETLYEASLTVAGKLMSLSLLDFID